MKYTIASERLGVIGESYEPQPGINIAALLDGGFIVEQASTTEEAKPAKNKPKKASKE